MNSANYRNFDLKIWRTDDGYTAQVQSADSGEPSCDFKLPFSEDKLNSLIAKLGPSRPVRSLEAPDLQAAKALGSGLFNAVFAGAIGNSLSRSIGAATQKGERVRIRLRLTGVPELANLPWEFLYDEPVDRFLVLSYKTSIARYLELGEPASPLAVTPPLRVLVVASSPHGYDALSVEKEWKNLQTALGRMPSGLVALEKLKKPTLSALQERLSRGSDCHVFHFIGHGGFDTRTNKSVLVLEDENRQASFVDGDRLGVLLHNHNSMRLTLLNACQGASASSHDVFSGVAQSLIRREIPAVVAMQFEISDSAAVTFAGDFYEAIARGNPLDAALLDARLAIFAAANGVEWGTPVLYLHATDAQVFNMQPASAQGSSPSSGPKLSGHKPRARSSTTATRAAGLPPLESPEGTMPADSAFYVERKSDEVALREIGRQGVTIAILGPRQVGKSSLLIRMIDAAGKAGKRVALLDFQLVGRARTNADMFFPQFCSLIARRLRVEDQSRDYFERNRGLGNGDCCTYYVEEFILEKVDQSLVLAIDEADIIFDSDFSSDFFGMLRSWHNNRAVNPLWKKLDLVLITSTEPGSFIKKGSQSPFNVAREIKLADFTPEQVADLNRRHGGILSQDEERRLIALVGGHPFLVRLALYVVASRQVAAAELFGNATADEGSFGSHLRGLLSRLQESQDLVKGMNQVIIGKSRPDDQILSRLQGAGLVRREGSVFAPRCQLYALYLKEHLDV